MRKIKKSLLSVCLSISLMFGCLVPSISVHASGDVWSSGESYNYFQNHFEDINTRLNGVIINQNGLREDFEDFVDEYRDNYNISSGTSSSTWIGDNISGTYQNGSSGVADLGFSETFRQAMRDWCNTYLEANVGYYYGYSFNGANFLNTFDSQDHYHAFLDVLNNNNGKVILYSRNTDTIYVINDSNIQILLKSIDNNFNYLNVAPTWNWSEQIGDSSNYIVSVYNWSSSGNTYSSSNSYLSSGRQWTLRGDANNGYINIAQNFIISLNTTKYIVYKSIDSLKNGSEGIQSYYTTGSYNSTISGSYNTTTSEVQNTIDSNNVNNYINNYYVENGEYPTPTQINIYINNYDGDDNGGGSGGSDDDSNNPDWDFGFLGTIGEFLAELISGLGEIVGGILSAITSIISSLREGIPNTIGLFMEWFFPFLPTEIVALIELSILCAVILGVVRLIRGH